MTAIRLSPFGGMIPAVDDRLLPDTAAAYSLNAWLYSGTAAGLPALKELRTNSSTTITKVYRIPRNYVDNVHFSDSIWLEFTDAETDVIKSTVINDTFERYYYFCPTLPPKYNTRARIVAGLPPFLLGIPQPGAIGVSASGGSSSTNVTRAYVVTWVSAYGEEGQPSDPVIITNKLDATYTVTLPVPAAGDLGTNRNLTLARVYRTVVGTDGTTTYFFVKEVPIATVSTTDNASDATISLNSQLDSTNWNGPPSDLAGAVTLSNGMVAGWRANEVWFCEPYRMHAWPSIYTVTVEYPIIGMGVSDILAVLTNGYPYVASGSHPESMSVNRIAGLLPCTSRGSIVPSTEGVFFSTPQGLGLISSAGAQVITRDLIRKDRWTDIVPSSTLRAVRLGAAYYGFGSARFGVFEPSAFVTTAFAQEDFSGARKGLVVDPTNPSVAFSLLSSVDPIVNVFTDAWSAEIFIIKGNKTYWLDISDVTRTREPFVWRSKIFQLPKKDNLQAMKVFYNTPSWPVSPVFGVGDAPVVGTVSVYADGRLVFSRNLGLSGEQWRLPSGFKADFWQIEVTAGVEIANIQAATSPSELRQV